MLIRASVALLIFVLVASAPAQGQDQSANANAPAPIATDRPTVTNSSIVVPYGYLQAENGFLDSYSQGQNTADGPETALRFGIAAKTELRMAVPDYFYNVTNGGGPGTGFGDVVLGVKQQLGPTYGGFDVSATVFLSFPSGAKALTSGGYDPGVQVAWSHGLSAKWSAAGMFSMYWPTVGRSRNLTGEATILLDRQLAGPWDVFGECVGDFPERYGTRQILQMGTSLKLGKNQQLDAHYGLGLTPAAMHHFVGIGYSFRFQVLHRR